MVLPETAKDEAFAILPRLQARATQSWETQEYIQPFCRAVRQHTCGTGRVLCDLWQEAPENLRRPLPRKREDKGAFVYKLQLTSWAGKRQRRDFGEINRIFAEARIAVLGRYGGWTGAVAHSKLKGWY